MFAAGLVKVLATYPEAVVERAVDPSLGVPRVIEFLNLAAISKHMDIWRAEYLDRQERLAIGSRKALPEPARDPEEAKRVYEGLRKLSDDLAKGILPRPMQ